MRNILDVIKQRRTLEHLNKTSISVPIRKIHDVIVLDSCAYVRITIMVAFITNICCIFV